MNETETITILDHTITINDMIEQLYYISDISLSKCNDLNYIYNISNDNNLNNDIIIKLYNKLYDVSLIENNKNQYLE